MTNSCNCAFYRWKLYYSAGQTIMDHIYKLHHNCIDKRSISKVYHYILQNPDNPLSVCDAPGAYTDMLCRNLAEVFKSSSDIFLFSDEYFSCNVLSAIYVKRNNLLVFKTNNDGMYLACYCINSNTEKYIYTANQYFKKAVNIAKSSRL